MNPFAWRQLPLKYGRRELGNMELVIGTEKILLSLGERGNTTKSRMTTPWVAMRFPRSGR
jgi:hypothetical protein